MAPRPDLVRWLLEGARQGRDLPDLFTGYCERLAASGLPVWRVTLGLEVLHPEESGTSLAWVRGGDGLRRTEAARAGILASPSYLASPTRVVDETDRSFRCRLDGEDLPAMPLLEELRGEGATDYLMLPLPFLDRTRTAVMSFATRRPGGFDGPTLAGLADAAALFSPYAERVVLRRIAIDLLAAYLGPAAGGRVFAGQVERGDVATVEAAVWICDLRGFTALSEAVPRREVVALLNRWFDVVAAAVEAGGGEILKFVGDGLLAVFPVVGGDAAATCDRALDAAAAAAAGTTALNAALAAEGRAPLAYGLALHLGEVELGNVGARRRLDFTVIGPAVNRASRIEGLTKLLGEPVLASAPFALRATRPMRPVGRHVLRGTAAEVEVWAPVATAGGATMAPPRPPRDG